MKCFCNRWKAVFCAWMTILLLLIVSKGQSQTITFDPDTVTVGSCFKITVTSDGQNPYVGFFTASTTCVPIQTPTPLHLSSVMVQNATTLMGNLYIPSNTPAGTYGGLVNYWGCNNSPFYTWTCNNCITILAGPPCSLPVAYVDENATGLNDGSSWANAFTTLQGALCSCADTIKVAAGTYYPDEGAGHTNDSREATFFIPDGRVVLGGYEGLNGDTLAERNWACNPTILSGNIDQVDGNAGNSYNVVEFTNAGPNTLLDGFIIEGGNADAGGSSLCCNSISRGGGIHVDGYNGTSNPTVSNCRISGNYAKDFGTGGVGVSGGSMTLINCIISGNGGVISNYGNAVNLINCTAYGNNNLIVNYFNSTTLTNCIVWGNGTTSYNFGNVVFLNSIVQNAVVLFSNAFDVSDPDNKINVDPLFVDAPNGNYRLSLTSPAINMGDNAAALPLVDFDGHARIMDGTVDIGAFEYFTLFAGKDTVLCASENMYALSPELGLPGLHVSWSGGNGTFLPNDTTLNAKYMWTDQDVADDSVKLVLTAYEDVGNCILTSDTVTLILDSAATVYAGEDQTVCPNDTIFLCATLSGLATGGAWQTNDAFGSFVGSDTDLKAKFVLNATGKALGSIKFGFMTNDPTPSVCEGGLDTVEIFIGTPPIINVEEDSICLSDSGKLIIEFKPEMIGCNYELTVKAPDYTATIFENITDATDTVNIRALFNNLGVPWDDTSYTFDLLVICQTDTLCPASTSLTILPEPDLSVDLDNTSICEDEQAGLIIKVNGIDGDSCLANIWYNTGTDSGWTITNEKIFVNVTYTYDVGGLLPGPGLPVGNYTFKVFVDCGGQCPNASKSVLLTVFSSGQTVLYVDSSATGLNTGLSWEDAYTDLQDALSLVQRCNIDTILVAEGTYYPARFSRDSSFNIPDSIKIFGGFPSGGSGPRDWACNKTILCGDIDQDGTLTGNSFHIVTTFGVDSFTVVDGFCIQNGNADSTEDNGNGVYPYSAGGGWLNDGSGMGNASSPTIRNCIFTGNQALYGAGMMNSGSGYGFCNTNYINCIFNKNISLEVGGGIYNTGEFFGTCIPRFFNSIISGNAATFHGGGMANIGIMGTCAPQIINSVLNGNAVGNAGGALYNFDANPVLINCITWNHNLGNVFIGQGTHSTTISYSITQSGAIYTPSGFNKPDGTDPSFIYAPDYTDAPTSAGNFHVMDGSMAIDMGDNGSNTYPTDLDGLNRILDDSIDIGAYEKLIRCDSNIDTLFVLEDGTVPAVSVDSFLRDTLPNGFQLFINGISYTDGESVEFSPDILLNVQDLLFIRNCDTIDRCFLLITILDTFDRTNLECNHMVCNDLVNVSLVAGCMKTLTQEDLLENPLSCRNANIDVQLIYPFGTNRYVEEDKVDLSHIGYTMVYNVYETATGNKCWGYVHVEDKQPPLLNCSVDTITCYELADLSLLAEGEDSCSGVDVKIVSDEWLDYGCDQDTVLSGYVVRTIQGSDKWGNFARCTDTIFIRKTSLDSMECPELVELPCEITHQLFGSRLELKTAFTVDQSKVTPEFLLDLQKATWELKSGGKGAILDPNIIVVPQIEGKNIYPDAGGSCKITALYHDTYLDACGAAFKIYRKWIVTDWCTQEEEICEQYIKVIDTSAPKILKPLETIYANVSPHDCVAAVNLPALIAGTDFKDCGPVTQKYTISYEDLSHPGKVVVLSGDLPSKTLYLPKGEFRVEINLADACFNRTDTSRTIVIEDLTPPIPVCNEITQVTIDPATCWAKISAKDLDNGSRDNCCDVLHYAAAHMDSITYWKTYWTDKLTAEVGEKSFAKERTDYEALIEDWINCYVFSDTVNFTDCGSDSIVLRVYEACGIPRFDPHVFPCGPHAWFCYNTYQYIGDFNWNWFDKDGPKSCTYRPTLTSLKKLDKKYEGYATKGYLEPKYEGAAQYEYCQAPFYFPSLQFALQANSSVGEGNPPGSYCSDRLYNDCMVVVLVDDKQAPVVHELEDITVYCDDIPTLRSGSSISYYAGYPKDCSTGKKNGIWPGYLKDSDGTIHGYYGGSGYYNEDEHSLDCGHYDHKNNWAPVYCREWLYLDSFDTAGQINPETYFKVPVLFDKGRPVRELEENEFSFTDNCRLDSASLTYTDDGDINSCGEGWIQRTWTIRDQCGNEVIAKQKVLVKHRSDFEVVFPEDKVVECDFLNTTDPEDTGEPEVTDDECEQVGIRHTDEIFTIEGESCYKIVRTWTLIDWCIYDPARNERYPEVIVDDRLRADTGNRECVYRNLKDNNDGYMQYIQIIKVVDKVAPVVNTRDTIVCIYGEDCTTNVSIPLSATDNCTDPSRIRFRYQIDVDAGESAYNGKLYDANSIDQGGTQYETEFVFLSGKPGKHLVHVIGTDNCGNADTSSFRFELRDCKRPTPYCYRGIATVIMPSTGKVTVWAKDLDAGSDDNCTAKDDLVFSFSSDMSQTSREFSCADLPDGLSRTIPVEIWVTDEAGNQDHCSTYILLQDNVGNVCPDVAGLNVQIAGSVQTEGKEPVEFVTMNINGGGLQLKYETGVKGTYHFESLPTKSDYTIQARRKDQPMNGVSTLDLILIQKHILGTESLDSPYKIIAADVDNDKQVTAIDLVELRKLILASYQELPNAESWKFIPKAQQFSDPRNPWDFKTWMEMKQVEKDYMQEDWIGIKTGDVNASAAAHSLMGMEVRGNDPGLIFEAVDRQFIAGELVTVEFRSPNFRGIGGFQGTMGLVGGKWLVGGNRTLENGALSLNDQNFGYGKINEGFITMSWNSNSGMDVMAKEILFNMTFKANQNGRLSEALRIGSQLTVAESYEGPGPLGRDPDRSSASVGTRGEPGNLSLRFVTPQGSEVVTKSELYQNYPNPFDQHTVISLRLAQEGKGVLSIYDVSGKIIRSFSKNWTKGYHEVWLDRIEIGTTGVLYYRFESGFFTDTRKMVIVN